MLFALIFNLSCVVRECSQVKIAKCDATVCVLFWCFVLRAWCACHALLTPTMQTLYIEKLHELSQGRVCTCAGEAIFRATAVEVVKGYKSSGNFQSQINLTLYNDAPQAWQCDQLSMLFIEMERDTSPVHSRKPSASDTPLDDIRARMDLVLDGATGLATDDQGDSDQDNDLVVISSVPGVDLPGASFPPIDLGSPVRNRSSQKRSDERRNSTLHQGVARTTENVSVPAEGFFETNGVEPSRAVEWDESRDPTSTESYWNGRRMSSRHVVFTSPRKFTIEPGKNEIPLSSMSAPTEPLSPAELSIVVGNLHMCNYDLPSCTIIPEELGPVSFQLCAQKEPLLVGQRQQITVHVKGVPVQARNVNITFACGRALKISHPQPVKDFQSKLSYALDQSNESLRNKDGSLAIPLQVDVSLDDSSATNKTSLQNLERQLTCAVSFAAMADTFTEQQQLTLYFYFPFAISHKSFTNKKGTFLIAHLESCLPCVMNLWEHSITTNTNRRRSSVSVQTDIGPESQRQQDQDSSQPVCVCAEDFNTVLPSPTQLQPGQRLALMWRLKVMLTNNAHLPTVLLPCTASLQLAYSLSDSAVRSKELRCTHFMQFHIQETFFTSALVPAHNSKSPTSCIVGSFTDFDLCIRLTDTRDGPTQKADASTRNYKKLPAENVIDGVISYSIVSDHKHWMIAGRVRGVFAAADANNQHGYVTRVKLLPVSPGLLALPRVKLFWRSRPEDPEQHVHADYLSRGVQIRVNPGTQHNSPLHVSLY